MSKKLTDAQIDAQAKALGVESAALKAVHEVECRGFGFNTDNTPVILFERHVMRQRLIANGQSKTVDVMMAKCPDLCSKYAGGYGLYSVQHQRLAAAAEYHRESALESASWGAPQIMGFHWKALGFATVQLFVNRMFQGEAGQLAVFCRFIEIDPRLHRAMKALDWKTFADIYNGPAHQGYDAKISREYDRASR